MDSIKFEYVKVLVAEDDRSTRQLLLKLITQIGCTGICVENGREAVEMARKYNFDLCFMDLFMPEMGGVEAVHIIHEEIEPDMPIIALTASSMNVVKDKCLTIGMCDYIQKPVTFEIIKNIIGTYGIRYSK